ncbi:MAG: hypothetical protein V3U87_11460 [Methylococcaceae bacterium]
MDNWVFQLAEHWKKQKDIVQAFGLILYTDRHVNIKKVLSDNDYWAALDDISGPKWPVFSIKPLQGTFSPDISDDKIGLMVPVWKEPLENMPLLEIFGLQSTKDLPKLIVFCSGRNNEILHHTINLKDNTIEEAYSSLKMAIEVVTMAIEGILPENWQNGEGIFSALNLQISSHKEWEVIKTGFNIFKFLKDLKL